MQVRLGVLLFLSLYLTLNFVISSLIVGTFKSACETLLDIYEGWNFNSGNYLFTTDTK